MGNHARKRKHPNSQERKIRLTSLGCMVIVAVLSLLSVTIIYRSLSDMQTNSYLQKLEANAEHDAAAAVSILERRENAIKNWAYTMRKAGFTDYNEILRTVNQDAALLGVQRLFLVDDLFNYYGGGAFIMQVPKYNLVLKSLQTEVQTLPMGDVMLVCVQIKPFTVDGATICYALAEYDPAEYRAEFSLTFMNGAQGKEILDANGRMILQISSGRSLNSQLSGAQSQDYMTATDLKYQLMHSDHLCTLCQLDNESGVLVSSRLPGRDWLLLTFEPAPEKPFLFSPVIVLFILASFLLAYTSQMALIIRFRARILKRQLQSSQEQCKSLQNSLDAAQQTLRSQEIFLDMISHNIRTPLNGIVGYTSLAKKHSQESEKLIPYLEKIADASGQLLARLNEGLDATGWHRYIDEEIPQQEEEKTIELSGKRILLVEDNSLNREIGEAILSDIGILVETAENGEEGFQRIATSKPGYFDLVLMDIQMPVMDGYEATKTIRRLRSKMLAEIPILAMTANVSQEDKRKAFESGMNGYVEKPIIMDKLLKAIQIALSPSHKSPK